jgi:hypothetical protein
MSCSGIPPIGTMFQIIVENLQAIVENIRGIVENLEEPDARHLLGFPRRNPASSHVIYIFWRPLCGAQIICELVDRKYSGSSLAFERA